MIASLFWQLPVQMDILSPFGLTLTTAPHTSSLASSKDSPIKHNSCKQQSVWTEQSTKREQKKLKSYCLHPVAVKVIVSLLFAEGH